MAVAFYAIGEVHVALSALQTYRTICLSFVTSPEHGYLQCDDEDTGA